MLQIFFGKGDASLANNYRPISLLNTTEKVFERLIFSTPSITGA
jgi:hypothetical protein